MDHVAQLATDALVPFRSTSGHIVRRADGFGDDARMMGLATNQAGQTWLSAVGWGAAGGALAGLLYGWIGDRFSVGAAAGVGAALAGGVAYYTWKKT